MIRKARLVAPRLLPLAALFWVAACARQTPPPVRPAPPQPRASAAPPVRPAPETRPAPPPTTQPTPREPAAPPRRTPRPVPEGPILLKVGLATDLPSVTLPCCASAITAMVGDQVVATVGSLKVEPAAGTARQGFYRLQVAALRDERQAQGLAKRLGEVTGQPGEAYFDAGIDLYRVRLGHYPSREEAEKDVRRLNSLGMTGAFVINEDSAITEPALRVVQGERADLYPGRWLAVTPAPSVDEGILVQGKRYRGRILVFLNDRGTLNLINELPVEQYLRGVVPSEMGPEQYKQLEALKAQAVAARTYALRNLGEFTREGYDICATPRCQVYNGMNVEHPFSDRAVAETDGQVLVYKGEMIDALYSSTCGGHTEDVRVIFPLKDEPYLKAVPCMEHGMALLDGNLPPGRPFPAGLTERIFPKAAGVPPVEVLSARFEQLALMAGLPAPAGPLVSLDRRQVQRYVATTFDLGLDARLLVSPADVAYLLHEPPADWSADDLRRAAYFVRSGLIGGPLDQPLSEAEIERLLLALAELLQVVRREEVSFFSLAAGVLSVRAAEGPVGHPLPGSLVTFRRRGEELESAGLALVPGDKLTLFWQSDRLVAALQQVDLEGVAFDRSSRYSSWTRYRTDAQLASQVAARFPGMGFRNFTILERGPSGRVGKIRVEGDDDKSTEVDGIAIRWTLDVPDTLFTAKRLTPQGQAAGWLFTGRGWGHGVGMCQVGAYGMAQRGHTYRDILTHYYSGVELSKVRLRADGNVAPARGR